MSTYGIYKVSHWCYKHRIPLLPKFFKGVNYLLHSCAIAYEAEIGERTRFAYGGLGVVVGKPVVIGEHVIIGTNVTLGGKSNLPGAPHIGNNVYIATGAKVLGPITISDNVIIGANAVVTHDVPSNCSVAGVPAKILKENIDVNQYCSLGTY